MTAAVPTNEPLALRSGLTWAWKRQDLSADYPAPTWTLTYWFKKSGATGANFSIIAPADGAFFAVSVSATTTATYTAGDYTWVAVVSAAGASYEVDRGTLKLLARYDQAANLDDRSHARKVLDAIEAVLENRASIDQMEYQIAGRMLKRMPIGDLMTFRNTYRGEVYAEQQAEAARNGKGSSSVVVKL